jgi:hypothetical protein
VGAVLQDFRYWRRPPGRGKRPVLRRRRIKACTSTRAEARRETTLWGSFGESNGPENASCYARGVDEAHVGEILEVFGVNGRLRGPVVTEVVSDAAQLGADLPARIRRLAELENARILTEGEFEVK